MSSALPEDIYAEIANAVMSLPKGTQGEERESLRKLRDSTLLNLSLTSRDVSLISLPAFYRNVTATPFTPRLLLPCTRNIPSPFIHTRSLTLSGLKAGEKVTKKMQDEVAKNENRARHPELTQLNKELVKLGKKCWESQQRNEPIPDDLKSKGLLLQASRSASISSILIENMPNLQLLDSSVWSIFHFAKLSRNQTTGNLSSRPLLGLSNLRFLKVGSLDKFPMTAANCVWLMIFLPNLIHLRIIINFSSRDEKFLRDHEEVLAAKSKVTHLEIAFKQVEDEGRGWAGPILTNIEILEMLLKVTKGLVKLKLRNTVAVVNHSPPMTSPLRFLKCLKASFKSLKYLFLSGDFAKRSPGMESEALSIKLDALEMISFDSLSTRALNRLGEESGLQLHFPSLTASHLGPEIRGYLRALVPADDTFIEWIKGNSFPSTVKKIYLDENMLSGHGRVVELGAEKEEWERTRASLIDLCQRKKLEVKILKEGEQLPFGLMPEPEDL